MVLLRKIGGGIALAYGAAALKMESKSALQQKQEQDNEAPEWVSSWIAKLEKGMGTPVENGKQALLDYQLLTDKIDWPEHMDETAKGHVKQIADLLYNDAFLGLKNQAPSEEFSWKMLQAKGEEFKVNDQLYGAVERILNASNEDYVKEGLRNMLSTKMKTDFFDQCEGGPQLYMWMEGTQRFLRAMRLLADLKKSQSPTRFKTDTLLALHAGEKRDTRVFCGKSKCRCPLYDCAQWATQCALFLKFGAQNLSNAYDTTGLVPICKTLIPAIFSNIQIGSYFATADLDDVDDVFTKMRLSVADHARNQIAFETGDLSSVNPNRAHRFGVYVRIATCRGGGHVVFLEVVQQLEEGRLTATCKAYQSWNSVLAPSVVATVELSPLNMNQLKQGQQSSSITDFRRVLGHVFSRKMDYRCRLNGNIQRIGMTVVLPEMRPKIWDQVNQSVLKDLRSVDNVYTTGSPFKWGKCSLCNIWIREDAPKCPKQFELPTQAFCKHQVQKFKANALDDFLAKFDEMDAKEPYTGFF